MNSDKSILLNSEEDLQLKILDFLHTYYPKLMVLSMPIDKVDCENKMGHINRLLKYGYHKGTPDILIPEKYIAIELKRPMIQLITNVSQHQEDTLNKLSNADWTCYISNDYTDLIHNLTKLLG